MKSKLLFVSTLLNLIFASVFAFFLVIFACGLGGVLSIVPKHTGDMTIVVLIWSFSCVASEIVFSALLLNGKKTIACLDIQGPRYNTPVYQQKINSNLMCAISFNILLIVCTIFLLVLNLSWFVNFVCILEICATVTCVVLLCVGYYKETKPKTALETISIPKNTTPKVVKPSPQPKPIPKTTQVASKTTNMTKTTKPDQLQTKLEKLADMYVRGLITEEEYKALKTNYIKKSL